MSAARRASTEIVAIAVTLETVDLDELVPVQVVSLTECERAVDRALRRRLPGLLEHALAPLAGEVATALADVESSVQALTVAEERVTATAERARLAEARAALAEEALTTTRTRIAVLEAQVAALTAPRRGLLRRRGAHGIATAQRQPAGTLST